MSALNKPASAVVFLPGTLCNAEVFASQVKAFDANCIHNIVIDYGYADTLSVMLQRTIHQVNNRGFRHVTLVAFSMGGMLAFELLRNAHLYEFNIEQLILISSNALADTDVKAKVREQHFAIAKDSSLSELITHTFMPNYLYKQNIAFQEVIVGMAEILGIKVFASQLKVLAERPDSTDILQSLRIPCFIIAGQHDVLCPPSEQLRMASAAELSGQAVVLTLLEDCGHFAIFEQAERINQLLLERISTSCKGTQCLL
jgi:pimeloyl-ACP methyl ester carboxylesterase